MQLIFLICFQKRDFYTQILNQYIVHMKLMQYYTGMSIISQWKKSEVKLSEE